MTERNYNVKLDVDEIIGRSKSRMTALMRQSIQETVNIAQKPTGKGGKMRVDTGFLRASGQASLNGMPSGPVRGTKTEKGSYDTGSKPVTVELLSTMQIGSTFFYGWTANYAKYREAYDGFLEAAIQQWPQTVARITAQIKAMG